jgi:hypothetical protein
MILVEKTTIAPNTKIKTARNARFSFLVIDVTYSERALSEGGKL